MWSSVATIIVIAVASNLDNAGVGIAYGVRRIQISWFANALIAVISGAATYFAGAVGGVVTRYVHPHVASLIGALLILMVGGWVLLEPWRKRRQTNRSERNLVARILRDPVEADFDRSKTISIWEAFVLGIALAINALAGGFDAGVVHLGVGITAVFVALFSYVMLGLSIYVGSRYAADTLGDKATYIAGLLLVAIGIHQVW